MAMNVQELVEIQLTAWETRRQGSRSEGDEAWSHPNAVVISYAPWSDGERISEAIAARLDLPHHDHDIVEHIASTAHVHTRTVELLDRNVRGWIEGYLESLFLERNFDRSDYLRLLGRTVVALFEHGPCVISGHGAVHFLPRDNALVIRLTATEEARAERMARVREVDMRQARRMVHRADSEQRAFHHRYFGADVEDVDLYDLVVDTSRLGRDGVAGLVARAFELRFGSPGETPA